MNDTYDQVRSCISLGDLTTAEALINQILELNPLDSIGWANLSSVRVSQGNLEDASKCLANAIQCDPHFFQAYLNHAQLEFKLGRLSNAHDILLRATEYCDNTHLVFLCQGNLYRESGDLSKALDSYSQAISLNSTCIDAYWNRGLLNQHLECFDDSIHDFEKVVELDPSNFQSRLKLISLYSSTNRRDSAIPHILDLKKCQPNDTQLQSDFAACLHNSHFFLDAIEVYKSITCGAADPHIYHSIASCFESIHDFDSAQYWYQRTLDIDGSHVPTLVNYGNFLLSNDQASQACSFLSKAFDIEPHQPNVIFSYASYFYEVGLFEKSEHLYKLLLDSDEYAQWSNLRLGNICQKNAAYSKSLAFYAAALSIDPRFPEAWYNLGLAHHHLGNFNLAEKAFRHLVSLNGSVLDVHLQLGHVLYLQGRYLDALDSYRCELQLNPQSSQAKMHLIFCEHLICNWDNFFSNISWIESSHWKSTGAIPPWQALSLADNPQLELDIASAYSQHQGYFMPACQKQSFSQRYNTPKVRLGFISSDFFNHATMHLAQALFDSLDQNIFELFFYDYSPVHDSVTSSIASSFSNYFSIHSLDDPSARALLKSHHLDYAFDLKGYTSGSRPLLFIERIARYHVSFLGYPGTSGSNIYDFIIADDITVPPESSAYYSEKVLRLKTCYQPANPRRHISVYSTSRSDHDLPPDKFVFCCFNANYKISPVEFNLWVQILAQTDSVLWILRSTPYVDENLRMKAVASGIKPNRLVFCDKCEISAHLERHRHANLQLDTFNVNAHTTAADSLYAGLPILTKMGNTFSSRVCSSLLTAAGLPQLITLSPEDYVAKAVHYARNPNELRYLSDHLIEHRESLPLFDVAHYTRAFQDALLDLI